MTTIKLGNAEYLTTLDTPGDVDPGKWDRRYVLVDGDNRPIIQRLHGDRHLNFVERDREVAFQWATQITKGGLSTFVFDAKSERRLSEDER